MRNLQAIRNGGLINDLNESLQSLVTMVMETGRAGSVNLKISLKPVSKNDDQLMVSDTMTIVPPKALPGQTVLWVNQDGELVRNAPDADDRPLREVG